MTVGAELVVRLAADLEAAAAALGLAARDAAAARSEAERAAAAGNAGAGERAARLARVEDECRRLAGLVAAARRRIDPDFAAAAREGSG